MHEDQYKKLREQYLKKEIEHKKRIEKISEQCQALDYDTWCTEALKKILLRRMYQKDIIINTFYEASKKDSLYEIVGMIEFRMNTAVSWSEPFNNLFRDVSTDRFIEKNGNVDATEDELTEVFLRFYENDYELLNKSFNEMGREAVKELLLINSYK